jgi:hypothetical protein
MNLAAVGGIKSSRPLRFYESENNERTSMNGGIITRRCIKTQKSTGFIHMVEEA